MKITIGQLRRIIREEINRRPLRENLEDIIILHRNDPDKMINHATLSKMRIPVSREFSYHVVYDAVVKQDKDGKDVEFWDQETGSWKPVSDKMRHHPVSVHNPD
jgi:hypothetical protein